jgi:hypothetical protein
VGLNIGSLGGPNVPWSEFACELAGSVIKSRKVGFLVALVVVMAVGTILLTPDSTDDVDGILRPHKVIKTFEQISTVVTAATLSISRSAERSWVDFSANSAPQAVFRMTCTYRC